MRNLSKQTFVDRKSLMDRSIDINPINRVLSLPFLLIIRFYQFFSPLKQFILGPLARCRFHPTCSEYALECFLTLPLYRAIPRSLSRIFKCNPMHPGGYDPVHQKLECEHSVD
ncbi:MAG: membrane protein insertion efficiency factor YidD [Opitutae bacterium]